MSDTVWEVIAEGTHGWWRQKIDATEAAQWSWECLEMIRGDLEAFGIDMKGTPPMFYNDALRSLVARLGKAAGCRTGDHVRALVRRKTALVAVPSGGGAPGQ